MPLLQVSDLRFGYSATPLFEGVSFRLEAGERAGLVAPNGAGKSTLLRLIAGEIAPDGGSVVVQKGERLGYYRQSHEAPPVGCVLDALLSGFGDLVELRHELERAQHAAASGTDADLEHLAAVTDRYHAAGGDTLEHRVAAIASRLGFATEDLTRDVSSLSGGERGRLQLGATLATEPRILLLDEPTNHLDLDTIDWLASVLARWSGAVLVVSHDRAFLDAVCPITLELGRSRFRVYPMSYSRYETARLDDLERETKAAEEQAAFVAKTEEFIRKNIAGQKTKQAQSRRRMLEKLERVDRPEDIWRGATRVRFRFADAPRSGDIVLEAKGLEAERGGRTLFRGVDLLVRRGERIGIVGANGSGKTTLLKLLAGEGAEDDRGNVRQGSNLRRGYFDQQLGSLNPEKSGVEEVRSIRGDFTEDAAREYLARLRFYGDDPFRRVASLSGGERTRLALAKLLLEPRNVLFLDEPTNHLDIFAAEILEEALIAFEGTVVFVSHDRRFLENVTTRVLAFTPTGVEIFSGGFRDYARSVPPQTEAEARPDRLPEATKVVDPQGPDRHRERQAQARKLERQRKRAERLENDIADAETSLNALRSKLVDGNSGDWEKLHEMSAQERALTQKIDQMLHEWEEVCKEVAMLEATTQGARSQGASS